jgi:hypothetical protein
MLDENTIPLLPGLKAVSETNAELMAPGTASNVFKYASAYRYVIAVTGHTVNPAVDERRSSKVMPLSRFTSCRTP